MAAAEPLLVLVIDADDALRAALSSAAMAFAEASGHAALTSAPDVLIHHAASPAALVALTRNGDVPQAAFDTAVVVTTATADDAVEADLLRMGVEAITGFADAATLSRAIRHAAQRKRMERAARTAYATDLATGLPHQTQLLEHMAQLLALREREPSPMVLLVLRIDGYAGVAARLGAEAANVLRRKVAVRLRSGLRASDVVAAIGPDAFGVLLGHLEAPADGERVAAKLAHALQQPLLVAGQTCMVAASVGVAHYPEHGKDAHALLQRASAQAGSVATLGSAGFAARTEQGTAAAANDDDAS